MASQLMTRLPRLAAALLIVSNLTHVAQLAVYGRDTHVIAAAAFGVVYFAVGLLLVRGIPCRSVARDHPPERRRGLGSLALRMRAVQPVLHRLRGDRCGGAAICGYLVCRGHETLRAAVSRAAEAHWRLSSVARSSGRGYPWRSGAAVRLQTDQENRLTNNILTPSPNGPDGP